MAKKTKRIEKLTDEQVAMMATVRDRWLGIGLSTQPADRPRAEAAVRKMYEAAGLEPVPVVWCSSPLAALLTASVVKSLSGEVAKAVEASVWDSVRDSVWDSVRNSVRNSVLDSVRDSVWDSVWDSVGNSVGNSVWDSVRDSVWDSVGNIVGNSVWDSVRNSVEASVWDSVRDSVWDSVEASVWDSVRDSVRDSVWNGVWNSVLDSVRDSVGNSVTETARSLGTALWCGQHDAGWLSFYSYFRDVCVLIDQTDKMVGLFEQAESSGWWLAFNGICYVTERPRFLLRDAGGRLHSTTSAALEYPDGWGVYAIHGTRIPAEWITRPGALTPQVALQHPNVEQRRAAAEILGWERIVSELKARTIDVDPDPMMGTLLEVDLPDSHNERFLRVKCGTGRFFCLPVPPTMKTAVEANAWTYGIEGVAHFDQYRTYSVRT